MGEYPRALRLASELADLRAADADRIPLRASAGGARSDGGVVFPKRKHPISGCFRFGGATRNRTGDEGFADLCLTAWLWRRRNDTRSSHGRNKEKTGTDEGSEPGFKPDVRTDGTKRKPEPTRALNPARRITEQSLLLCRGDALDFSPLRGEKSGFKPDAVRKRAGRITGSFPLFFGADYGARTRHLDLGKVALYQMS